MSSFSAKNVGTWALAVLMPVAVTVWPFIWNGFAIELPWHVIGWYCFVWAAQWLLWTMHPVLNCTALILIQSALQTQYTFALPQLWPAFVLCGNVLGLLVSAYLFKGASRPGKTLQDWYCGVDLHPIVDGVDLKLFIASRIGMQSWALAVVHGLLDWAKTNVAIPLPVVVSAFLQLTYIYRFFTWEKEYRSTMDQQHDRAGFYVCWGCMAYIPALYWIAAVQSSPGMFTTETGLGWRGSVICAIIGLVCIYAVSIVDEQKTRVRANPMCFVAGRPATFIRTKQGSLLLTCGGWGLARHLQYAFEIGAALAWTAPVAGTFLPGYMYCVYLAILLVHRTYRDDERCSQKYGADWEAYCKYVPYRIVPGIF
jgi:7-dehydrocholesterol reductase